jgi:hypothetical protein
VEIVESDNQYIYEYACSPLGIYYSDSDWTEEDEEAYPAPNPDYRDVFTFQKTPWPTTAQRCVDFHIALWKTGQLPDHARYAAAIPKLDRISAWKAEVAAWHTEQIFLTDYDNFTEYAIHWVHDRFYFDAVQVNIDDARLKCYSNHDLEEYNRRNHPDNWLLTDRSVSFNRNQIQPFFMGMGPVQLGAAFTDAFVPLYAGQHCRLQRP